jgi:probable phosphomutase (TIGR03848 family)
MGLLLLVRHGQSTANSAGILAGRAPGVSLDEVGLATTTELNSRLIGLEIAKVISSPMERTVETAHRVFAGHRDIVTDERLTECDYGSWTGRKLAELTSEPLWSTVQQRPDEMIFPDGESMQAMADRAIACVTDWNEQLKQTHGDKFVFAVVSHADVIKSIVANSLGLQLRKFQSIVIEPTSVSAIRFGSEANQVLKVNDTGANWLAELGGSRHAENTQGWAVVGGDSGKAHE